MMPSSAMAFFAAGPSWFRWDTAVVVSGTMLLGLAAGIIGTFMLLRKRALIGDTLSHSTLPGIALAFLVMTAMGGEGKWLPGLLLGAVITGFLGVGAVLAIRRLTRIKEDAALGIVLSVFFGFGIALLGLIQQMPTGSQAGLDSFIYGKAASMLVQDAQLIGISALLVVVACTLLAKEFAILSFDAAYASAQGWPVHLLDIIMMALVTAVTVIGLQAVGLILMIALLIIPAAAASYWTHRLGRMLIIAGGVGAASGLIGSMISAIVPDMPAGAVIVLVAAAFLTASVALGPHGGFVVRSISRLRLRRRVSRQHLLRAMYEWFETRSGEDMPRAALEQARSWSPARLRRSLNRASREGLIEAHGDNAWGLTTRGHDTAARFARNHRLWEMFLITYADIAPSHVDRDADQIEHVLGNEMVAELERLAATGASVPPSPHAIEIAMEEST